MYHLSHNNKPVILFDLDDTLCNSSHIREDVLKVMHESFKQFKQYSFEKFVANYRDSLKYYKQITQKKGFNTYSRISLWENLFESLNIHLSISEINKLIDIYWQETYTNISLYPNVKETLKKLFNKDYIIAIVSGGDFYSKSQKLIKLGIDRYFSYIFSTDLVQKDKQTGAIYKHVLKTLNLKGSECIMVGDTIDQDIEPANKLGITTIQVTTRGDKPVGKKGTEKPDYIINNIKEISSIIHDMYNH
ncbi:MAG TPA: HAD-IA family hydrolase [Candidatus Dojkabacteria bacterium]|nr:HAD-IA family hydrolase [Candidatus Dojkabacteria bacterium]